jgi:hypothetical protein
MQGCTAGEEMIRILNEMVMNFGDWFTRRPAGPEKRREMEAIAFVFLFIEMQYL